MCRDGLSWSKFYAFGRPGNGKNFLHHIRHSAFQIEQKTTGGRCGGTTMILESPEKSWKNILSKMLNENGVEFIILYGKNSSTGNSKIVLVYSAYSENKLQFKWYKKLPHAYWGTFFSNYFPKKRNSFNINILFLAGTRSSKGRDTYIDLWRDWLIP